MINSYKIAYINYLLYIKGEPKNLKKCITIFNLTILVLRPFR